MKQSAKHAALAGILIAGCFLLTACSLPVRQPGSGLDSTAHPERILKANRSLAALKDTDVLMRLDNDSLRQEMLRQLQRIDTLPGGWVLRDLEISFAAQTIALKVLALPAQDAPAADGVELLGDISLDFQSGQLIWQPHFSQLRSMGKNRQTLSLPHAGAAGTQGTKDTEDNEGTEDTEDNGGTEDSNNENLLMLLQSLHEEINQVLLAGNLNTLPLNPMPLGILETGARLGDSAGLVASDSHPLEGVFVTAGVAVLIEEQNSSIALDLNFLPSVANCAGAVDINRATFARSIRNREPVDSATLLAQDQAIQHFFTEVTDTKSPGHIIHYWFADGEPASVSELDVQPSARWRTWSSRPKDRPRANRWEVVVVEKGTGCVLQTMAVVTEGESVPLTGNDGAAEESPISFSGYRQAFLERTGGFPAMQRNSNGLAMIDVRRGFMTNVLGDALYDVQINSTLNYDKGLADNLNGTLKAFPSSDIQCTARQCDSSSECTINYNNCPVERDTRVCTSCLIRNPLNNRCMSEAEDPICEAARASANERLTQQRDRCVAIETSARDACETLRRRDLISCQRQSASQRGACEAGRDQLTLTAANGRPLAAISGQARASGSLTFQFSGFRLEGDLQRLRMELGLTGDLVVKGNLSLQPTDPQGALTQCLNAWQGPFTATTPDTQWRNGLVSTLNSGGDELHADWSGFTQRLTMRPAPFQALFLDNPEALQQCQMGLDIARVVSSVAGEDAEFMLGELELVIQPLPTRIQLLPAFFQLDGQILTGEPVLGEGFVSYEIE